MLDLNAYHELLRMLERDRSLVLDIRGNSMKPSLSEGDRVQFQRARVYLPGDIVAFYECHNSRIVVHRVAGYFPPGSDGRWRLITFSDVLENCDAAVSLEHVLGRACDVPVRITNRIQSIIRYCRQICVSLVAR